MIEAPEPPHISHSNSHSGGGQRGFDMAMALAVLLVSAGSLLVTLQSGNSMEALVAANERLVRAQSTPILQYDHGNISDDGQEQLEFSIRNVGTGPARVVWFEMLPDGKRYSTIGQWLIDSGEGDISFTSSPINRTMLAPNDERRMATWKVPADAAGRSRWTQIDRERFDTPVRACYCSVFDQCWQSNLEADIPQEVPNCEREDVPAKTETLAP